MSMKQKQPFTGIPQNTHSEISEISQQRACDRVYFLIKWETAQVFFGEFCEISKSTLFIEHMRAAASNERQPLI